jgi:6-phosphogluconolactonase
MTMPGQTPGAAAHEAPGEPAIEVLADPEAVSRAAAERIAAALSAAVQRRGRADWATTGGSAPVGIYRALAEPPLRDEIPWGDVQVWWGDDRFVPRDHPLSNVQPLDQVLLRVAALAGIAGDGAGGINVEVGSDRGAPIPPGNLHVMPMDAAIGEGREPAWVANSYERELQSAGLPASEAGVPILDLVLAGIGGDGHILSVFPGSEIFAGSDGSLDTTRWVAGVPAPTHIEPHVARVSLNPAFLAAARLVLIVVTGSGKADVLGDVLGAERDPSRWPSQHARQANAVWLIDEAAATKLRR